MNTNFQTNKQNEFEPFFGGDGRSQLFMSFFVTPDYRHSINESDPNAILNTPAWEIMTTSGYFGQQNMAGNEIAPQFTDFIAQTALFHRTLDKPTGTSLRMEELENVIASYNTNGSGSDKLTNYIKSLGLPQNEFDNLRNTFIDLFNKYNTEYNNNIAKNSNLSNFYQAQYRNSLASEIGDYIKKLQNRLNSPQYTTASNKYTEQFIQNVYGKWNNLSEDAKRFYRTHVSLFKNNNGNWEKITDNFEIEAKNASMMKNNYRVNLNKRQIGSSEPLFFDLIPKIPTKHVNKLYYYDITGQIRQYYGKITDDTLQDLYITLYQNIDISKERMYEHEIKREEPSYDYETKKEREILIPKKKTENTIYGEYQVLDGGFVNINEFNGIPLTYDENRNKKYFDNLVTDNIVRKSLWKIKQNVNDTYVPKDNEEVFDFVTKNTWKRDGGKLFTEINGKKVYMDEKDPEYQKLLTSANFCYATATYDDPEKCKAFIHDCILDQDPNTIKKCIDAMTKSGFADSAKQQIKNLSPMIAVKLLNRLGFRTFTDSDSLKKVETVDNWITTYADKKFGNIQLGGSAGPQIMGAPGTQIGPFAQLVSKNEKLLYYLRLLTEFINANPAILNPEYKGGLNQQEIMSGMKNEYACKLGIPLRREYVKDKALYDIEMLNNYLKTNTYRTTDFGSSDFGTVRNYALGSYGYGSQPTIGIPEISFNYYTGNGYGNLLPAQFGGNPAMSTFANREPHIQVCGSRLIEPIIKSQLEQMASYGRHLSPEYIKKIMNMIQFLKDAEVQLVTDAKFITEYGRMLSAFKGYKSETLSEQTLKNIVNSNKNLYGKYGNEEKTMVNIMRALQNMAYGYETKDATQVNDYQEIQDYIN